MVLDGMANGTMDAGILRDSDPSETLNDVALYITKRATSPFEESLPGRRQLDGSRRAGKKRASKDILHLSNLLQLNISITKHTRVMLSWVSIQ
jgi:hypothetical protein